VKRDKRDLQTIFSIVCRSLLYKRDLQTTEIEMQMKGNLQKRPTHYIDFFVEQPIAERVAQNFEMISATLSTYQYSAHEIYDSYHVMTW